jgi:uncharacterized protein
MVPNALIQLGSRPPRVLPELSTHERLERLRTLLRSLGRVVVAYSGGVDSSLVLALARAELGDGALGVIGRSDSYSQRELELALDQARTFGARVEVVTTGELSDPQFSSNPADRCYHCKSALYRELSLVATRHGAAAILDGTIADDLADHRPGRRAAAERAVRSPLAELGFSKRDVRAAAAELGLKSAAKPASPCLASRIPYGTEITRQNLSQVERAEDALRALGFEELRVRHYEDTARIEVPMEDLPKLAAAEMSARVVAALKRAGYARVTLDLEGLRSGNLNQDLALPPKAGTGAS